MKKSTASSERPQTVTSSRRAFYDVQLDFFHHCGGGLRHLGFSAYSPMCFAAAEKDDCEVHCEIPYEKLALEGKMPKTYHVTVRPCGGDGEMGLPLECQIGSWYD